jgi:uncharacterized protein YndB with AHSA1/START domain
VADERPTLRLERRLPHPAQLVWQALTEPKELSQWYPFRVTDLDLRLGGPITFEDEAGNTYHAVITELDPRRLLAFHIAQPNVPGGRERDNHLTFELRPDPAGCLLIFTHVFADRPAAASYAAGWGFCLDALESLLAGEPITPPTPEAMHAAHESQVAALRLDEGTLEPTATGWRLRFERQFMMIDTATVHSGLAAWGDTGAHLSEGPGGARLELTIDGTPDQDPEPVRALWRERIESLAARA